jgi:hypothetical protein
MAHSTNDSVNDNTNDNNTSQNSYINIVIEYPSLLVDENTDFTNSLDLENKIEKIIDNIHMNDNDNDNEFYKTQNQPQTQFNLPISIINELKTSELKTSELDIEYEIKNLYIYKTCSNCEEKNRSFKISYDGSNREICDYCYSEYLQDIYDADEHERYLEGIKQDRQLRLTEYGITW